MDQQYSAEYLEREKRVNNAIACKVPDRVPLLPLFGGFSSSYAGISRAEELYDPVKCFDAVLKTTIDFEPDMAGPTLSFGRAMEKLGGRICIMGNVFMSLMVGGTPEEVEAYCKKIIDVAGKDGGFIMSGAAVLDNARPENVRAMMESTREYGLY